MFPKATLVERLTHESSSGEKSGLTERTLLTIKLRSYISGLLPVKCIIFSVEQWLYGGYYS